MLFKSSDKVTLVLYADQKVGRSFELKRSHIKFVITIITLLVLSSLILSLYLVGNVKNIRERAQLKVPQIIEELKTEKDELSKINADLEKTNKDYLKKISSTQVTTNALMPLFNPTIGSKDISDKDILNIDNIDIKQAKSEIKFDFDIINNRIDSKASGYIFILMKNKDKISLYPENALSFDDAISAFNRGETFNISRFRKVNGFFKETLGKRDRPSFKIFIFNKTGDLLYKKSLGPVSVEVIQ